MMGTYSHMTIYYWKSFTLPGAFLPLANVIDFSSHGNSGYKWTDYSNFKTCHISILLELNSSPPKWESDELTHANQITAQIDFEHKQYLRYPPLYPISNVKGRK